MTRASLYTNSPRPMPLSGPGANGQPMLSLGGLFTNPALVYGYANARVHAMVSFFLTSEQLRELAAARTVDVIIEMLERTSYKDDLVALSLRFRHEELVELALGREFAHFASKLLRITPPASRPTIAALLARWDAHNLKTIILARKQGKKFDDIAPYLVLAGTLREEDLRGLLQAGGSEPFYALLRATAFGADFLTRSPARPSLAQIKKMFMAIDDPQAAIEPMLGLLDVFAFQLADESIAGGEKDAEVVRLLLRREADAKNLSTVLRLARASAYGGATGGDATAAGSLSAQVRRFIVPGGSMGVNAWVALAALGGVESIAEAASRKIRATASAMDDYRQSKSVSSIETALAAANARAGLKTFHRAGVSLGVIVGALLLKEQEMHNIRKIVRGKAQGLSEDEIRKMLVTVG